MSAVHRWRAQAPESPAQQHVIDYVRGLRAPRRPLPAPAAKLLPAGLYWIRHTPQSLPPGADTIARWNGAWWSSIGAIARWEAKDVTVLSAVLKPPKIAVAEKVGLALRAKLFFSAIVGSSTAWPLPWAAITRLPLGWTHHLEPTRQDGEGAFEMSVGAEP